MKDMNIGTLSIGTLQITRNDMPSIETVFVVIIMLAVILIVLLIWTFTGARRKREKDPIWNEADYQYYTFQFHGTVIMMFYVIVVMIIILMFVAVTIFSNALGMASIALALIVVAIRVINLHHQYYDSAKETVQRRRGLLIALESIASLKQEIIDSSKSEKLQELALQYISALNSEKFMISVRSEDQKTYVDILDGLSKFVVSKNIEYFEKAIKNADQLSMRPSFSILKNVKG